GMCKRYKFLVVSVERGDKNTTLSVIPDVSEISCPKKKMVSVGKKDRPTMRLLTALIQVVGYGCKTCAVGVHAPDRASGIGRINNDSAASPTSTACRLNGGKSLRRAARDRYFAQFAVGEESKRPAIGRLQWITC